jgi:uncharacterized protein YjbI with pentapeptide repeats
VRFRPKSNPASQKAKKTTEFPAADRYPSRPNRGRHPQYKVRRPTTIVDLDGARLAHANLNSLHLSRAVFLGAHLTDASLVGAHLDGANFSRAHLDGADLFGAHLSGATLSDDRLGGMNLSYLSWATIWPLSRLWLADVRFRGSSRPKLRTNSGP